MLAGQLLWIHTSAQGSDLVGFYSWKWDKLKEVPGLQIPQEVKAQSLGETSLDTAPQPGARTWEIFWERRKVTFNEKCNF